MDYTNHPTFIKIYRNAIRYIEEEHGDMFYEFTDFLNDGLIQSLTLTEAINLIQERYDKIRSINKEIENENENEFNEIN